DKTIGLLRVLWAADVDRHFAPERSNRPFQVLNLSGIRGIQSRTDEDRDLALRNFRYFGGSQEILNAREIAGTRPAKEVVEGQHGVSLSAAEGGLQLYNRFPAETRNSLECDHEETSHSLRYECTGKKLTRILIFDICPALDDLSQVCGKLRLLVPSRGYIPVRDGHLAPGSQTHSLSSTSR